MSISLKVYNILTKKYYSRNEPLLRKELMDKLEKFITRDQPIKLVGFWGVGLKDKRNWADVASCEFLKHLNNEVIKVHKQGIEFTFIFATQHGIHNGVEKTIIDSYTRDIGNLFKKYGFKFLYLDSLWEKYNISFDKIDTIYRRKPLNWWPKVEHHEMIEKNAKNRNTRLHSKEAAQKYYIMRDLEKKMLEKEFQDFIFHAFADARLKSVLPHLPTLYLHSRKGWSDTPWFVVGTER